MDCKFNIKKYSKFSLATYIILNNSIFAGCNKKGNKGYSGKGDKSTETNNTHNKETSKKPEKQNNDYKEKVNELLELLNNIEKDNELLTDKIAFSKLELENQIKNIDSDEKVKNIENELNNLKSKIEEAKKKEEEAKDEEKKKEEEEKKVEEERKKLIENFKTGYKIDDTYNLTIKLEGNKFKLYFNETTLIAESENKFYDSNIEKIDDYKKSKYTIILSFHGRHEHTITGLQIGDIINHIKIIKDSFIKCDIIIDHCFLPFSFTYKGTKYDGCFYDVNTGYLYRVYKIFDLNSNKEIWALYCLKTDKKGNIWDCTNKVLSKDKYGKSFKKEDGKWYFKEDNTVTDINDEISNEAIKNFSNISLKNQEFKV